MRGNVHGVVLASLLLPAFLRRREHFANYSMLEDNDIPVVAEQLVSARLSSGSNLTEQAAFSIFLEHGKTLIAKICSLGPVMLIDNSLGTCFHDIVARVLSALRSNGQVPLNVDKSPCPLKTHFRDAFSLPQESGIA